MSFPTNQVIDNDVRLPYGLFITSSNQAKYSVRYVASFFMLPLIYANAFSWKHPSLLIRDPLTLSVIEEDFFFYRSVSVYYYNFSEKHISYSSYVSGGIAEIATSVPVRDGLAMRRGSHQLVGFSGKLRWTGALRRCCLHSRRGSPHLRRDVLLASRTAN